MTTRTGKTMKNSVQNIW